MSLRFPFSTLETAHVAAAFCGGRALPANSERHPASLGTHRRKTGGAIKAAGEQDEGMSAHEDDVGPEFSQDWRTFRAQLVAQEKQIPENPATSAPTLGGRWVHELSAPERGCLLVARYDNMGMFSKTVILVLAHNDAEGTVGVILNRPTALTINETPVQPFWVKDVIGDDRLYLGGPVNMSTVNIIHGCKSLSGAKEIVEGVYQGGDVVPEVVSMPGGDTIHIFMGYAGWGEYQLAAELHDKAWWVLAASKGVILGSPAGVDRFDKDYSSHYWNDVVKLGGLKRGL